MRIISKVIQEQNLGITDVKQLFAGLLVSSGAYGIKSLLDKSKIQESHDNTTTERMVVTFDFDDTLLWRRIERDEEGEFIDVVDDGPNPEGLILLKQAINNGYKVYIVTTRSEKKREDTQNWLRKWNVLDKIAGIHFTDGKLKRDTLAELGSQIHYDDDIQELENLPSGCEGVLLYPHPSQR